MAIRTIDHDEALDSIWDDLVYTEARLLKDASTADLAPAIAGLLGRLETTRSGQLAAWRAETIAQAGVDDADDDLDDAVADISVEVLHAEKQDRSSARYKRYFSQAPHLIIKQGLQTEIQTVQGWVKSLKSEPEAALQSLGARLDKVIENAASVLKERVDAASKRADHRVRDIYALVDDINGTRRSIYGILVQRGEEQKKPKDWPNRFFRRVSRPARSAPPPSPTG